MIRSWLTDQGLTVGPAFALLLFLAVFIGVLVWIFRPGSRAVYEHSAQLPLEGGDDPSATDDKQGSSEEDGRYGSAT